MSLDSLLLDASSFVQSEFNLQLQQSQLKLYSPDNWQKFCQVNGFDANSEGLYVPVSYSAYVRTDSPVLISNIFHEFYGHGLFIEHSQIGKKLVEIIKTGKDEKSFLFKEVNPQEQIFGIAKYNIHNYEGFAVWLEALLCEETGNSRVWQLKKDRLPSNYVSLFEFFQDAEQRLSRFGLIAQMGFPKFYDKDNVLDIIKRLYDSAFAAIDFVILRGSQKPYSDIDLFIVSTNPSHNFYNGWLDIYELNRQDFFDWAKKLDISVTDPLFTGTLIYGDKNAFEQIKQQILKQPITQEAILHHLREIERLKAYKTNTPHEERSRQRYIQSFTWNLQQLQQGNKPLTYQQLKEIYHPLADSPQDPVEIKGCW